MEATGLPAIRSTYHADRRFEAEPGRGGLPTRYDAARRTSLYVRLLSTAVSTGLEAPPVLACDANRATWTCQGPCGFDLDELAAAIPAARAAR